MFGIISPCSSVLQIMKNFFQVSYFFLLWSVWSPFSPSGLHGHVGSFVIFETGWGHFAQFTIAVANKDPKKSKFSGEFLSSNFACPFLNMQTFELTSCRYAAPVLEEGA